MNAVLLDTLKNTKNEKAKYSRMRFRFEKPNTKFYVSSMLNEQDGILLTKRKQKDTAFFIKKVQIKKSKSYNTTFSTLNTWNLLNGDYYDVFKVDNGYMILPSTIEKYQYINAPTINRKIMHNVGTNGVIMLGEFRQYLFSKKNIEVTVDIRNGCYLELKPTDERKYPLRIDFQKKYGTEYLQKLGRLTYCVSSSSMKTKVFALPFGFMRYAEIIPTDELPIYKMGEKIIIEGKTAVCPVCGNRINYYEQPLIYGNACVGCYKEENREKETEI